MSSLFQLVKNFQDLARKQGTIYAMKHYLGYLGYKNYSEIEYPNGIRSKVRTNDFWRKLSEEGWENNTIQHLKKTIQSGQTISMLEDTWGVILY